MTTKPENCHDACDSVFARHHPSVAIVQMPDVWATRRAICRVLDYRHTVEASCNSKHDGECRRFGAIVRPTARTNVIGRAAAVGGLALGQCCAADDVT